MARSFSTCYAANSIGARDKMSLVGARSRCLDRRLRIVAFISAALLVTCGNIYAQDRPSAETIITNANVWTVDRNHPQAEAVAILNQRIVAVGTSQEMDAWRGPQTRIIDAAGKLLLPGFNDAHVHFVSGGFQLDQVQLTDAHTREEFVSRIAAQVKKLKKSDWILGGEWDEQNW